MKMIKAWAKWLWDWVTVITGILAGGMASLFELLDYVGFVDWTSVLPAGQAAKITLAVAILKGLVAWWQSRSE